jgi:hypothetical protein
LHTKTKTNTLQLCDSLFSDLFERICRHSHTHIHTHAQNHRKSKKQRERHTHTNHRHTPTQALEEESENKTHLGGHFFDFKDIHKSIVIDVSLLETIADCPLLLCRQVFSDSMKRLR